MPKKFGFNPSVWIADENGNIYYIKRDSSTPAELKGTLVSRPSDKWMFENKDELIDNKLVTPQGQLPDKSVSIVKMLLTLGVATAVIPKGIFHTDAFTNLGECYVINLASFDKTNVYWPDESLGTTKIKIEPFPMPPHYLK